MSLSEIIDHNYVFFLQIITIEMKFMFFNFKGVMPYVPKVLPAVIPDPAVRRRAEEAFLSEDFKNNIESYFVDNIKVFTN